MTRWLYALGVLTIIAAGGVLMLCARSRPGSENGVRQFLGQPGAIQSFTQSVDKAVASPKTIISPLVAQAQAFAAYLNPPTVPVNATPIAQETPKPAAPPVRPDASSPKFKVLGTSYFADEPGRSMTLIRESGADSGRWLKEGMQIGHFTIHEIRPGSVVCMAGEKSCEIPVDQEVVQGTAAAGVEPVPVPSTPTASDVPRPTSPAVRSKRPTGGTGPTVRSDRTAALD